jgi:hypothetical protein
MPATPGLSWTGIMLVQVRAPSALPAIWTPGRPGERAGRPSQLDVIGRQRAQRRCLPPEDHDRQRTVARPSARTASGQTAVIPQAANEPQRVLGRPNQPWRRTIRATRRDRELIPGDLRVTSAWNATVTQPDTRVTATNASYNAAIAPRPDRSTRGRYLAPHRAAGVDDEVPGTVPPDVTIRARLPSAAPVRRSP